MVMSCSPSVAKSSSQLLAMFRHSSMEANCFRRSLESRPPKLSCGFRFCKALGEMAVAKSLSQLSSPRISISAKCRKARKENTSRLDSPGSSGEPNTSAPDRSFARERGRLARGCSPAVNFEVSCPICGRPALLSEPVEALKFVSDDSKARFQRTTSSTASVGFLDTGASLRRQPTIHGCLLSFLAETLKFGSF